jgi:beta-lactamase class A
MIIISDNSATNMCIDLVGLDEVNTTMRSFGLEQTAIFQRLGDTKAGLDARKMSVSTAGEMTSLLELIARHEAVSREASEDMLRIMRRQDYRHELSRLLPWNEMNMLDEHRVNWVAEKGGSFLNGIRTSGAVFSGPRGQFAMSVFCEGGTGPGTGRESEGNRLNGELGFAAWQALAAR